MLITDKKKSCLKGEFDAKTIGKSSTQNAYNSKDIL